MHIEFFAVWWASLVVAVPLYWLIPRRFSGFRLAIPVTVSITLIALLSVQLLVIVLIYNFFVAGVLAAYRRGVRKDTIRYLSWASFLLMFLLRLLPQEVLSAGHLSGALFMPAESDTLILLSASYLALRAFIVLRESITRSPPGAKEVVGTLVFGGSFLFGPVVGATAWMERRDSLSRRWVGRAIYRIFLGVLMVVFMEPFIREFDFIWVFALPTDPTFRAWFEIYVGYITFYLIFAGYTNVAIGLGMLYGVKLPENFNYPFLATSIKDFWRRWHISLADFVKKYLFLPFVRKTGNPYLGLIVAFMAVGVWHAQSAPYLIWGVGHGVALAINLYITRTFDFSNTRFRYLQIAAGWAFTLTYVGVLSTLAKQDTLADVGDKALVLLGLTP